MRRSGFPDAHAPRINGLEKNSARVWPGNSLAVARIGF